MTVIDRDPTIATRGEMGGASTIAAELAMLQPQVDEIKPPVRVVERGSQLPSQAEFKLSDTAQNLDDIRSDARSDLHTYQVQLKNQLGLTDAEKNGIGSSRAERLIVNPDISTMPQPPEVTAKLEAQESFMAAMNAEFSNARSIDELKSLAMKYAKTGEGLVENPEDGWFKAVPGSERGRLILASLDSAQARLEKRGNIERARQAASRVFDSIKGGERGEQKKSFQQKVEEYNEPKDAIEEVFIEELRNQLAGARNIDELKDRARKLVAHNGLAEDPDQDWFKPADDSREARLAMNMLIEARENLKARSMHQKLRDRESVKEDRRQAHLDQRAERLQEAKERAQREIQRRVDDFEAKLEDVPSFKDYVAEKQAEVRKPYDERIAYLRNVELPKLKDRKNRRRAMSSDWIKDGERMDKQIQKVKDEITKLEKQAQKAEKDAKKEAKAERRSISEEAIKKSDKALDLIDGDKPGRVSYSPENGQDPDKSLVIADRIGKEVGKQVEANGLPFQVNEYKLNGVAMQRLVYRTSRPDVVVVEEWNKEAGALKRQTIMKGSDVLITNSENDGFGRIRGGVRRRRGNEKMVLNDALYADDKLVKSAQSWSDGGGGSYDTDAAVSYASRLDRSGISSRGKYEMASGRYKTKNSKGTKSFIRMLQESLVEGKGKK